jgi:hypothetical protein
MGTLDIRDWVHTNYYPLTTCYILRPTVSRLVCLGIMHPSATYDQIFITVRQLQVC